MHVAVVDVAAAFRSHHVFVGRSVGVVANDVKLNVTVGLWSPRLAAKSPSRRVRCQLQQI